MRSITIAPALNGFVVQVGCQTVVFDSRPKLIAALGAYLENPSQIEQQFMEQAVNKPALSTLPPQPQPQCTTTESIPMANRHSVGEALERNPNY